MRSLLVPIVVAACLWQPAGAQTTAPAEAGSAASSAAQAVLEAPPPFDQWLTGLIADARSRGFSEALVQSTLVGLEPLHRVVASDRNQAELVLTLDRYVNSRITAAMVRRGREMEREHRTALARIERTFGVQRRFVMAIWGLESRYGRNTGRTPVFQALATLAWEPRRSDFFRNELFDALTMVARGHIDAESMTGSWAGAMGQTQFMPSSYLQYAVDFDQDDRIDIWRSVPDALASIANYLKGYGWTDDETWGREVRISPAAADVIAGAVPKRTEGCFAVRGMTEQRPLTEWQRLGVRRLDGGALPDSDIRASVATVRERSFLVYRNYEAILGYNCSHLYALSISMLADRLR